MLRIGKKSRPLAAVGLMSALMLSACGGSGGAGTASSEGGGSGSVGVMVTDAPIDRFEEVNITIEEILLLGAESGQDDQGQVSVFRGPRTVDLLALEGVSDLLGVESGVPAGDYEKIRLRISDLALVDRADDGTVAQTIHPRLPANGKIDLNPRQTFTLNDGESLLLELDLDAGKSIHLVETGSGDYRFRPVVFVRAVADDSAGGAGRLSRVHGVVDSLADNGDGLRLCELETVAAEDDADAAGGEEGCVRIAVDPDTGVFEADGDGSSLDIVAVGDELTAIGFFRARTDTAEDGDEAADDGDGSEELDDVRLDAVVLELGGSGTWSRLDGTVDTAPGAGEQFEFAVDADEDLAAGTLLTAQLQPGTRIFDRSGAELDRGALDVGAELEVDAVRGDLEPELRPALIVVNAAPSGTDTLTGELLTVDVEGGQLTVATDTGDQCVALGADSEVVLVEETADGTTSSQGTIEDLDSGWQLEIQGEESLSGCFQAEAVIAEVP